jgi:hypothetical protein
MRAQKDVGADSDTVIAAFSVLWQRPTLVYGDVVPLG